MALISKHIPNLINGISQQPDEVRLPSQADEQINFLSSVVDGLARRPGTRHLAKLLDTPSSGAFVHIINRDTFEKYVVVILNGDIKVFDLEGNEKTVNKPHGVDYLKAFDPAASIRAVTVADFSFIVNRERITRAYDPNAGLTLTPVTQRFQTLRFNTISKVYSDKFIDDTGKWQRCWGRYGVKVNGKTYSQSAEFGLGSFTSMLAAQLTRDLGRPCVVSGSEVDIPLNPGETGFTSANFSGIPAHAKSCRSWSYNQKTGQKRCTSWNYFCDITPENVFVSVVQDKIVGYASPNGDVIPEAEATNKEGIVHVRLGDYGTTYKIKIDGVEQASYTTSATDRTTVQTSNIATQLYNTLAGKNLPQLSFTLKGNAILVRATNTTKDFTLTVDDSAGGKALVACKGRIQQFTDLPAEGFEGFTIKVAGQDGVEADDYYVQFSTTDDGEGTSGSWKEVAKKGLRTRPAPNTMPHRLVSNGDGTFTFEQIEWPGREAGDLNSAPEPSFINKAISDVFFFKNRLGFLADENVIFSASGNYYSFYPSTVLQSLDTHPIDVAVTNDKVSILRHAVPFNETLLLFSDQTQFIVRGADRLTKETINVDVTTRFEASLGAKPVGAGKNVFFGVERGPFAGVREYYVDPDAKVNDAADVSSHCPEYMEGRITNIAASSNEDMVLVTTDTKPHLIYAYKFYWQGNEKVQSSWSKWDLGGVVLGLSFVNSDVLVVIERDGEVYLERISLAADSEELRRGFKSLLYLDRLTYVAAGSQLPWLSDHQIAVDKAGNVLTNEALRTRWPTNTPDIELYVGERYRSYYRFSTLVLTESETRTAPLVGRLMLRFMTLNYVESGFFQVGVQSGTREPVVSSFTGRRIGDISNRLGQVPIDDGRYRFPIMGQAPDTSIWVESDSHLPCAFLSAEWEAAYHRISRRT